MRLNSMSPEESKAYFEKNGKDALCAIPHPSGRGHLICGLLAYEKFSQIAERHLSGDKSLESKIIRKTLSDAIIRDFVNRFMKRGETIDKSSVSKLLSSASKHIKKKILIKTHYIPCVINEDDAPEEFFIGPVHFLLTKNFLKEHEENFQTERIKRCDEHVKRCNEAVERGFPKERVLSPGQCKDYADSLIDGVVKNFSNYHWIAEVKIPGCDENTSYARAEIVVEGALNVLRLMLGEYYSKKFRRAFSPGLCTSSARLTKDENNRLHFSISSSSQGELLGKKWFKFISEPNDKFLRIIGAALEGLVYPYSCSHLQQRFLDALMWYGKGVKE